MSFLLSTVLKSVGVGNEGRREIPGRAEACLFDSFLQAVATRVELWRFFRAISLGFKTEGDPPLEILESPFLKLSPRGFVHLPILKNKYLSR